MLPVLTVLATLITVSAVAPAVRADEPLRLVVDTREVTRRIVHARLVVPATEGTLTLVYPRWIPGEHGPTGPISQLAGITIQAAGRALPWRRDPEDMYALSVNVPAKVRAVEVSFDLLLSVDSARFTAGPSASDRLAVINWNQVVLYPRGARARQVRVAARLVLPPAWTAATALPVKGRAGTQIDFRTVPLDILIDSPVLMGLHTRTIGLSAESAPPHHLHLAADSPAALAGPESVLSGYRNLVAESGALFGGRPYREYHFLLALSDHIAHFGLEHHESSDNRQRERTLLDEAPRILGAGLLPHELVHAWNGKHRRPADLVRDDFQEPVRTGLLWVYEGLTTYLGEVLTARSGLRTVEQAREALAASAAALDVAPGRTWRPLADTAVAAQILFGSPREWRSWRRGVDFYPESALIWLEADVLIRSVTDGKRSLDDFCRIFHGATDGAPSVLPYTLEDVLAALGKVAGRDWRAFFAARLDAPTQRAPLAGLEASGWRLIYRDTPTTFFRHAETLFRSIDLSHSLGLLLREDGGVIDAVPGRPAAKAGIGPGMRVVAVNGRRFTPEVMRDGVSATRARPRLDLLVENGDYFRSARLNYGGGARYPALERISERPDVLSTILTPLRPRK